MGTGAFDSVESQRNVDVAVAGDASAYLGIQPTDGKNGNYVDTTSDDALAIDLTGSNKNRGDGIASGQGLNANATTSIADVFEIKNQGMHTLEVAASPLTYGDVAINGTDFPEDLEGALVVLLVPDNPDENVDVEWGTKIVDLPWLGETEVKFPTGFIAVKNLSPGQKLKFSLLGIVLPESSIGSTSINDRLNIAAHKV
ncbi:hypothetical protein [Haloplanus vescus]|nr:hypothetical protein [Haloplanus vescus]